MSHEESELCRQQVIRKHTNCTQKVYCVWRCISLALNWLTAVVDDIVDGIALTVRVLFGPSYDATCVEDGVGQACLHCGYSNFVVESAKNRL
jgi:hypothetical protein